MNKTSEQLSFWQLLSKSSVEIPIIQRDYAQGREEQKKVRETFISSLSDAFLPNSKPIELDFVYGDVKNDTLYPLDGQQRLTTLFLLHWYIALKENTLSEQNKAILMKFTYQTRMSSREFCQNLIEKSIRCENIEDEVSSILKNVFWFVKFWEKDPTIKAMLTMLDAIHLKFREEENIWERLVDEKVRPITFHFIQLENFGLSDDLYIKMNARGKQLTDFENFKASFDKKINDEGWDKNKRVTDTFAHKVDTVWTDLFWSTFKDKSKFDTSYINFIANSLVNGIAFLSEKDRKAKEETIQKLFNSPEKISPNDFDENTYQYLRECLDIYSSNKCKYAKISLDLAFFDKGDTLFEEALMRNIHYYSFSYERRIYLFAQTTFLLEIAVFDKSVFSNWMRVVRNIVKNATIDSADTFIGAINLIKELSQGCKDIYLYLSTASIDSKFAQTQQTEEVMKAKIIIKDSSNKSFIHKAEDTNFFQGRISFALYCINCVDENTFHKTKLRAIEKVVLEYLDSNFDIPNDFRRALLTIRDGMFYEYWNTSYLYAVDAPKRCLIAGAYDLKSFSRYNIFRDYLKDLLLKLTTNSLDEIINDFEVPDDFPNWKKRLIKEKGLLDHSEKHFIAIKDNRVCYLIPQTKVANSAEGKAKLKKII